MAAERYKGHEVMTVSVIPPDTRWGSACVCGWDSQHEHMPNYGTSSEAFTAWERHVRAMYEAVLRARGEQ